LESAFGASGAPRCFGDAPEHWEPLVIPLLFDPGALDHCAIVGDPLLQRVHSVTTDVRVEGRCVVGRRGVGSGALGGPGIHDASAMLQSTGSPLLFPCYSIPELRTIVLSSGTPFYRGGFGVCQRLTYASRQGALSFGDCVRGIRGSTMLWQHSGALGATCYFPVIRS